MLLTHWTLDGDAPGSGPISDISVGQISTGGGRCAVANRKLYNLWIPDASSSIFFRLLLSLCPSENNGTLLNNFPNKSQAVIINLQYCNVILGHAVYLLICTQLQEWVCWWFTVVKDIFMLKWDKRHWCASFTVYTLREFPSAAREVT